MDEREKRKKILFTILGIIVLILLFFWIKSCSGGDDTKKTTKDITNIDLKTESVTLTVGEKDKLSYTIIPSTASETTKWISSDNSVVSVDARGNIDALKEGNAIISLVSESGVSDYTVVKVVPKETIDGNIVTVSLTENDVNIKVGTTKKILFDIKPIDTPYNEILWESSNNLVASVSSDGIVSGLRNGVTTITLKVILNDNTTVTDSATLTVDQNATLYLTSTIGDLKEGQVVRAVVALSDASISIVDGNVKSSSEKAATVSNITSEANYLTFDIKGIKKGNSTLKASATTSEGKELSLDIPIAVVGFDDLYISSGDKEIKTGEVFVLSGRMEPSISGSLDTVCASSSSKTATASFVAAVGEYNGSCQITGLKKGTSSISITIGGKKKTIKLTVVEGESGDTPLTPTGTDTEDKPVDITGATLTSIEAKLSKTEYQRNEAMGTLTVTAEYGNGEKSELSPTDYVMINDFDSSTLGNKTLNIAYTKEDVTKVTSVSYVISGSSDSSGGTSGRVYASTGGYTGGTSSSPGSTGSEIKYGIENLKVSDSTNPVSKDTYKGTIGIEATVFGDPEKNTHWIGVAMQCASESTDCTQESKDFIQATFFEMEYENGKLTGDIPLTVDGKAAVYVGSSWKTLESLQSGKLVDENGVTTDKTIVKKITNNVFYGYDENGKSLSVTNANHITFDTIAGAGSNTQSISDCGTLTLKADKTWYNPKDTAKVTITASSKNGCYVQSLTIGGETENLVGKTVMSLRYQYVAISKSTSTTVVATFATNSGTTCPPIERKIEFKVDAVPPTCTAEFSANLNTITVTGYEKTAGSGVKNIAHYGAEKYTVVNSKEDTITHIVPITESKKYLFQVNDVAGNSFQCQVTVPEYDCYQKNQCGGENGKDCLACEKAGCRYDERDSVHKLYVCDSSDGKRKNVFLWLDQPSIDNGIPWAQTRKGIEYEGIKYTCKSSTEVEVAWCAAKGEYILDRDIETKKTELNKNCQLCGCDKWSSSFDNDKWLRNYVTDTEALSSADFITAYRTAKSSTSNCEKITTKEDWKCGTGAELGPNAPAACKK